MPSILIIDDEQGIRSVLRDVLADEGYDVLLAEDGLRGLSLLETNPVDLVILDVWLPNMGGIDVLKKLKADFPDVEVIIISGHANIDLAVNAVKIGAFDFLEKPLSLERTITVVRNALALEGLRKENRNLKNTLFIEDKMIGESEPMKKIRAIIEQSAASDARILILGENGTGKELVARAIHLQSKRAAGPFVEVNCAAIPDTLIESELFGHEKGAFTSAVAQRKGKFELAHHGSIFLDEVADLSLSAQAKVLRVIQELTFERVGGEEKIEVDVRIIAATNKHIEKEIKAGRFREDLFFRLNVIPVFVPSLRERLEDLPLLIEYFMDKYKSPKQPAPKKLSVEALRMLEAYAWPGNIRELKNFMERVNIMTEEPVISEAAVAQYLGAVSAGEKSGRLKEYEHLNLTQAKDEFEKEFITQKLREHKNNISKAAQALGLYPSNLHSKLKKFGITAERGKMKGLTAKQKDVLDFIKDFIDTNKYPPTIREVAEKFKISVKGSYDHIKALEKKKFLKCHVNRSRAIEVVFDGEDDGDKVTKLPILGSVAAGKPLFAAENFDGTIRVPAQFLGKGKYFVLNVKGDSMQEAGIMDGDIAIINYRNHADNGDIVVALLDEAVTLKRFYRQKNRIMLKAENASYAPIFSQDVKILGKLVCIIRRYER